MIFKRIWYNHDYRKHIEYMYTAYFFLFIIPIFIKREIVKAY